MSTIRRRSWARCWRRDIGRCPQSKKRGLILYNTCSIRDKAEQKVFHRLADTRSCRNRASASACWAASRSRRARRFSTALLMFRWFAAPRHTASCRKCWCNWRPGSSVTGLDDRETDEISRPNSPPALTPTEAISPLSKAATSSAPMRGPFHSRERAHPHFRFGLGGGSAHVRSRL